MVSSRLDQLTGRWIPPIKHYSPMHLLALTSTVSIRSWGRQLSSVPCCVVRRFVDELGKFWTENFLRLSEQFAISGDRSSWDVDASSRLASCLGGRGGRKLNGDPCRVGGALGSLS